MDIIYWQKKTTEEITEEIWGNNWNLVRVAGCLHTCTSQGILKQRNVRVRWRSYILPNLTFWKIILKYLNELFSISFYLSRKYGYTYITTGEGSCITDFIASYCTLIYKDSPIWNANHFDGLMKSTSNGQHKQIIILFNLVHKYREI